MVVLNYLQRLRHCIGQVVFGTVGLTAFSLLFFVALPAIFILRMVEIIFDIDHGISDVTREDWN
jgi:hypothetical protein